MQASNPLQRYFSGVARHEWPALAWSFAYFFFLLCSYYVLRPLRDALAAEAGTANLSQMFGTTFLTMLVMVPVFGWLTSRFAKRRWLPACIAFFVLNLIGFYLAWRAHVTLDVVARVFFVWLTVFVMFVVSVFWSFMADLYNTEQAKRLYGFIAAGGTLGALIGAKLTALLAQRVGASNLMLLSAALLGFTLVCIWRLLAWQRKQAAASGAGGATAVAAQEATVKGGVLAGMRDVYGSRYLQGICLYVFLYTMLSTVLYFHQTDLLKRDYPNIDARAALLGNLAFVVNVITLLVQAFAFKPLLHRFGVTAMLASVPLLSVLGFAALAWAPTLAVLLVFGVLRNASEYSIAKPARETLFNSLTREQKYKAKNVIDTAVYRGGDWASAVIMQALRGLIAFPVVAALAVPLSVLWAAVGWWLGRQNERRHAPPSVAARTQLQSS